MPHNSIVNVNVNFNKPHLNKALQLMIQNINKKIWETEIAFGTTCFYASIHQGMRMTDL